MSQKATIQYINLLCGSNICSLKDLSSGQIFCHLVSLIEPSQIDKSKIQTIETWMQKLFNLKLAFKHLLILHEHQFSSKPTLDCDLLRIAKYEEEKEIVKLFQGILFVFLNCQNKQEFIKKIMEMGEESQHYMMDTVKKLIDAGHLEQQNRNNDSQYMSEKTKLLQKMDQLQHQIQSLKNQNFALQEQATEQHKQNHLLQQQIDKMSQNISHLNHQISVHQYKPIKSEVFDNSSLVQSLKQKLITQSVQHEKQKMRFLQQIEMMRVKLQRIDDMETRVQNYQQKVTQSNLRATELQQDLFNAKQDLNRKNQLIQRLEQKCRLLEQKINNQQLQKITLQVDVQKLNARNLRNDEFRKIATSTLESNRSDPFLQFQSKRQSQQQLSIANRRIKTLQKQLAKTSLKAQKANKLQTDKKQLQQTFVIQMNNKKHQIQILSSALIELRRMFSDIMVAPPQ